MSYPNLDMINAVDGSGLWGVVQPIEVDMDKGHAKYAVSGDQTVSAVEKPDTSQYVSGAVFSGKRSMSAEQVAKRIAAIKAAALKSQAQSSDDDAPVSKKAPALAGQ